jgi:hypothetical protein
MPIKTSQNSLTQNYYVLMSDKIYKGIFFLTERKVIEYR